MRDDHVDIDSEDCEQDRQDLVIDGGLFPIPAAYRRPSLDEPAGSAYRSEFDIDGMEDECPVELMRFKDPLFDGDW